MNHRVEAPHGLSRNFFGAKFGVGAWPLGPLKSAYGVTVGVNVDRLKPLHEFCR